MLERTSCWHSRPWISSTRFSSPLTWAVSWRFLPFALWPSSLGNLFSTRCMRSRDFLEICICKSCCSIFQALQWSRYRVAASARISLTFWLRKEVKGKKNDYIWLQIKKDGTLIITTGLVRQTYKSFCYKNKSVHLSKSSSKKTYIRISYKHSFLKM